MSIIGNAIMVGGQAEFTSPQWKDVNFIDYDGTLLYSYTASEFQSLSEMPANVSRQGLVPEGWNWSLSDAQSQVANMGRCLIGQTCTLDTNMVRVDIKLEEGQLSPYLGLQGYYRTSSQSTSATVDIDWGDGNTQSGVSISYLLLATQLIRIRQDCLIKISLIFLLPFVICFTHRQSKKLIQVTGDDTLGFLVVQIYADLHTRLLIQ